MRECIAYRQSDAGFGAQVTRIATIGEVTSTKCNHYVSKSSADPIVRKSTERTTSYYCVPCYGRTLGIAARYHMHWPAGTFNHPRN